MTVIRDYRAIVATYENEAYRWNAPLDQGLPAIVTYSFYETPDLPARGGVGYYVDEIVSFSEAQRAAFRAALDVFAGVTGLLFVETAGEAMINSYGVTGSSWGGWANYPYATEFGFDGSKLALDVTWGDRLAGYDFEIILHEIGHALGLSHPHQGDFTLAEDLDNTSTTVMSYHWSASPNLTLGEMDKTALQALYGAPQDTAGWDYGFDGDVFRLTAADGNDRVLGLPGLNELSGGAGDDELVGRYDDDSLWGGAGHDRLVGGSGEDLLDGGEGNDWLYGGNYNDRLDGGADDDLLFGGYGDDVLIGGPGDDRLYGGGAEDRLYGGDGNDILVAGPRKSSDDDDLFGGAGDDILKGNGGVNVLEGESGDDRLFGLRGRDTLDGGDGADELDGGGGMDKLYGGDGADVLNGGRGKDLLFGGAGVDLFVIGAAGGGRAKDNIMDFELGVDRVTRPLSGGGLGDVQLYSRNGGTDTLLKLDSDPTYKALFEGVTTDELSAILDDGFFY